MRAAALVPELDVVSPLINYTDRIIDGTGRHGGSNQVCSACGKEYMDEALGGVSPNDTIETAMEFLLNLEIDSLRV